jgi:hypothetical protein
MQIGYYAMEVQETQADRMSLLGDYVLTFSGEAPSDADIADFMARNPA